MLSRNALPIALSVLDPCTTALPALDSPPHPLPPLALPLRALPPPPCPLPLPPPPLSPPSLAELTLETPPRRPFLAGCSASCLPVTIGQQCLKIGTHACKSRALTAFRFGVAGREGLSSVCPLVTCWTTYPVLWRRSMSKDSIIKCIHDTASGLTLVSPCRRSISLSRRMNGKRCA